MVPKESRVFKRFGKGFLKWLNGGEENGLTQKNLKMFSPLKILNSPFSKERDFWSFSSFPFFPCFFFSLFSMLRLFIEDELGDF
jgi:hypothetical protein